MTDPLIMVLQCDASAPIGRLGDWLTDAGAQLRVVDVGAGSDEPPAAPDLDGVDGLIVLGGAAHAWDSDPVLDAARATLAAALAAELPTLGVCLGAQLLAVVAGGRVAPAAEPEYGAQLVAKRQAGATDPLFRPTPITPDVLQWHEDEVAGLPSGAVLLASAPTVEVQAFRVGRAAWGIQFHIETTPEIVAQWAADDADALLERGLDVDAVVAAATAIHDDLAEVWAPFAARFVEVAGSPNEHLPRRTLSLSGVQAESAAPITDPAAIRAALAAEMQAARGSQQP